MAGGGNMPGGKPAGGGSIAPPAPSNLSKLVATSGGEHRPCCTGQHFDIVFTA